MAATGHITNGKMHYAKKRYSGFKTSYYCENMVFFASVSLPIEHTGRSQLSLDISLQSDFDQQYASTQLGFKMSYVF